MASIKAGIFKFLYTAAITPKVYHRELPEDPEYPATIFHVISDISISHTHDSQTGPRQARLQLEVIAEDVETAEDAMESYFSLLAGYTGSLGVAGFTDVAIFDEGMNPDLDFEDEPLLRNYEGRSRDFLIVY